MSRVGFALLGFVSLVAGLGCSATTGSTWVSQPEPGPFVSDDLELASTEHPIEALEEPRTSRFVREDDLAPVDAPRPRLTRTVTLGEVFASTPDRAAAAPSADRQPVVVTVNNYMMPQPSYYDGYYGAPFFAGDFRPGGGSRPPSSATPSPPTQPGQNWPALPSYGPAFPFKTGPASPWR